jgi:hypothetical protein
MPGARLTQEQWAEARRLREALGLGIREIAVRFGVHQGTVRQHAEAGGWLSPPATASGGKRARARNSRSVVGRRELIQRLYKAMDTKLKLMERRMEAQMINLDKGADLPSADHERDTRTFGAIIKNIEQVKEMQADLERVAGGQPKSAADAELFAEADLQARGLAVTLSPFVFMDVPAGNTLTDPYTGATSQPAYPWRGRITVSPAAGQAGSRPRWRSFISTPPSTRASPAPRACCSRPSAPRSTARSAR